MTRYRNSKKSKSNDSSKHSCLCCYCNRDSYSYIYRYQLCGSLSRCMLWQLKTLHQQHNQFSTTAEYETVSTETHAQIKKKKIVQHADRLMPILIIQQQDWLCKPAVAYVDNPKEVCDFCCFGATLTTPLLGT